MTRIAASLAALLLAAAFAGCGGSGAEPDVPQDGARATLILDFQPNAVHAGIYAALAEGYLSDHSVDLNVQQPAASTDAPKLLTAGRADLAVMDISDLAIARERGADLVAVGAIVQRPLAAVIAGNREEIRAPADLAGGTVGVTGLPSDDAVLAAILDSARGLPEPPRTVTIGFNSVAALTAGRVDAATAFWNAEGVALHQAGVPIREFRVDDYGAPSYPELVLVTTREELDSSRDLIASVVAGLREGYELTADDPAKALGDLLDAVPSLDPKTMAAQLRALRGSFSPPLRFDRMTLERWAAYAAHYGLVDQQPDVGRAFDFAIADER
jgi:NitT/TauT family transport system substrate-binding protein/putative hydroxymethylpyrimidine transport system substrate-binding protein